MAGDSTFDVVSDFDEQELVNALDQTRREVQTRYDLKDTKTDIAQDKESLTITTASETSLRGVRDILESKMVKRGLSLKILKEETMEEAAGGRVRQKLTLQRGLTTELAKEISKLIRDNFPKVKPSIQGNAVRVAGKNRDDLQAVITYLREHDFPAPLQFENYRG
ncbi:MAG: YajQ family cyclic di-GMP-binding protein [Ktedonobacterales bacterium]|nr:YajQ family cyclic di-GMP-binding protein [Ktedonobacterales bacterium]